MKTKNKTVVVNYVHLKEGDPESGSQKKANKIEKKEEMGKQGCRKRKTWGSLGDTLSSL